jgi:hypothetical protein
MTSAQKPHSTSNGAGNDAGTGLTHVETNAAEAQRISHILQELGLPVNKVTLKDGHVDLITTADPEFIRQHLFNESILPPGLKTPLMVPLSKDDVVISSALDRSIGPSIVDTLAHNPKLVAQIKDSNGMIDQQKVNKLITEIDGSNNAAVKLEHLGINQNDMETLIALNQNFTDFSGSNNGKLELNTMTRAAFDGQQRWVDRLARDGNLPLDSVNTQRIAQYLPTDQTLRSALSPNGDGATISKDKVDVLFKDVTENPSKYNSTPELVAAVKQLHNSFNQFSTDGKTIDTHTLLSPIAKSDLPPTNPREAAIVDTLAHNPKLMAYISDGNGNISQDKVQSLYARLTDSNATPQTFAALNIKENELTTLSELNTNFSKLTGSTADGKLNIDTMARDAFGGNQRWVDRLARDGNLQLDDGNVHKIASFLPQNQDLAKQLSVNGDGATISKDKLDQVYQDVISHPEKYNNPEEVAAIKQLHNSFNQFSTDGKTLDTRTLGVTATNGPVEAGTKEARDTTKTLEPATKLQVTSVVDTLAYNRPLTAYISDSHGNVSQDKVQALLASLNGPDGAQLRQELHIKSNEMTTLNTLNDNFTGFKGSSNGSLNIDVVARDAYGGDQRWVDRLARDGNLPIDDGNRQKIAQYLSSQDPTLLNQLSTDGTGTTLSKTKIDQLYQDVTNNPSKYSSQPETIAAVKQLHNSFNEFSTDGKSIDVGTIHNARTTDSGGPTGTQNTNTHSSDLITNNNQGATTPRNGDLSFHGSTASSGPDATVISNNRNSQFTSVPPLDSGPVVTKPLGNGLNSTTESGFNRSGNGAIPDQILTRTGNGTIADQVFALNGNDTTPDQILARTGNGTIADQVLALNGNGSTPDQVLALNGNGSTPDQILALNGNGSTPDQILALNGNGSTPDQILTRTGNGSTPDQILTRTGNGSTPDQILTRTGIGTTPDQILTRTGNGSTPDQILARNGNGSTADQILARNGNVTADANLGRNPSVVDAKTLRTSGSTTINDINGTRNQLLASIRTSETSISLANKNLAEASDPRRLRGPGTSTQSDQSAQIVRPAATFSRSSLARSSNDTRADGTVAALSGKLGADGKSRAKGSGDVSADKARLLLSFKLSDSAALSALRASSKNSSQFLKGAISQSVLDKIGNKAIVRTIGDSVRTGKASGALGEKNSFTTRNIKGGHSDSISGGKIKIGDRPGAIFPGKEGSGLSAAQWTKILRSMQNKDQATCVPKRFITGGEILAGAFIISAIAKRNDKIQNNGGKGQLNDLKGIRDFRPTKLPPMFTNREGKLVGSGIGRRANVRQNINDDRSNRNGADGKPGRNGRGGEAQHGEKNELSIGKGIGRRTEQTRCPEKRYFTGAELAILLATAGITRLRADKNTKQVNDAQSEKGKLNATKLGDKLNNLIGSVKTSLSDGTARGSFKILANKQDSGKENSAQAQQANDKRFFPGAEIAVSALMMFAGAAKLRQQESDKSSFYPQERTVRIERTLRQGQASKAEEREGAAAKSEKAKNEDAAKRRKQLAESARRDINRRENDPLDRLDDEEEDKEKSKSKKDFRDQTSTKDAPVSEKKSSTMRATCLIGPGETLVSVAEHYYQDGNVGWLIADVNLTNVKETKTDGKRIIEVQSRQLLELPNWDEVTEFYKRRRAEYDPENLITIVTENQLDRELLDAVFKPLLSNNTDLETTKNGRTHVSKIEVNSIKIREPGLASLPELVIDLGGDAS